MKIPVLSFVLLLIVLFTGFTQKTITVNDEISLNYILEEEKLALDVYTLLYDKWGSRQFENIKKSEAVHVEKVASLLEKKNLKYSLLPQGKFKNQKLQKLFNNLIEKGNLSEVDALEVGAIIEDVDIFDLQILKKETIEEDALILYNFLECASKNHLRAFSKGLKSKNTDYKAQYISPREYQIIIYSNHYPCGKLLHE